MGGFCVEEGGVLGGGVVKEWEEGDVLLRDMDDIICEGVWVKRLIKELGEV